MSQKGKQPQRLMMGTTRMFLCLALLLMLHFLKVSFTLLGQVSFTLLDQGSHRESFDFCGEATKQSFSQAFSDLQYIIVSINYHKLKPVFGEVERR